MTTFLYSRVSSGEQATNGESLAVQREQLEQYAKKKKMLDFKFVEDAGVSATKQSALKRKGFKEIFSSAKSGDVIVATKLDRVFRSVTDAAMTLAALKRKNVELHLVEKDGFVAGSINDELSFNVLSAVAQFDSQLKSKRISEVKQSMKKRGLWIGGKKEKGFVKKVIDGKTVMVVDEVEKRILEKCVEWMKKRDEEIAKDGKKRAQRFTALSLRKKLMDTSFLKLTNQMKMNYAKTYEIKKNSRRRKQIEKAKNGNTVDRDFVVNLSKFSTATITRLMDKNNENNAVNRLKRMKLLQSKTVVIDGELRRTKRQARGGKVRQKVLEL